MGFPRNEERNKTIVLRHRAGEKPVRLAEEYNLTRQRVHAILKTWGPKYPDETTDGGQEHEH